MYHVLFVTHVNLRRKLKCKYYGNECMYKISIIIFIQVYKHLCKIYVTEYFQSHFIIRSVRDLMDCKFLLRSFDIIS